MSTTQSLQSCLEPLLLEPRDLMHQLLPSKYSQLLSFQCPSPKNQLTKEKPQHCFSLSKPSLTNKIGEGPYYVHPLSAKTSFSLSSKSLEMCTESLGSETGSGIDQFSLLAAAAELQSRENFQQPKRQQPIKKGNKHGGGNLNFPPPLTSISGDGVQVHTHREGGRLVIKAFSLSSTCSFFQAERGNGRLRLSLLKEGGGEEEVGEAEMGGGGEEGFGGENVKEEGGRVWSSSSSSSGRCNGERSSRKRLQSLPFCVVIGV